ncbi:SDR family oxidoreductase [Mesonia aestuariivivens]|uniref:SDR family oxidoreductase n=1 Tax=Mesonia aestuariivivens TaxID=2796128 RepID=A0ABS6W574_9FLAO|nr:SDR family oxidoreductase [Mesonia aestuariivivens]MBW2963005.1 SDR family oxidoreductase [Mesonia aestuariivivens]
MKNSALIVGASGIAGNNLAQELLENKWTTYGITRSSEVNLKGLKNIKADLLDPKALEKALKDIEPTHVFFTAWILKDSEEENIKVNSKIVRNLLDVLSPKKSVKHVALVTGLKHYLGPFENYAKAGFSPETPVRTEHPRLALKNFYYAQEDEVYEASKRDGFTWSIHRAHTMIGQAVGNLMNMGTTLAVYASICKEHGTPFIWPGSEAQWNGISDVTDASILAKQFIWAATTPAAENEAFNIVNGDVFRWSWLWKEIANYFGIEYQGYVENNKTLEEMMQNDEAIWKQMSEQHKLVESELKKLASPWHTDLDLGRPIEVMTNMAKSRQLGFKEYHDTRESFFNLFTKLKEQKIIPA